MTAKCSIGLARLSLRPPSSVPDGISSCLSPAIKSPSRYDRSRTASSSGPLTGSCSPMEEYLSLGTRTERNQRTEGTRELLRIGPGTVSVDSRFRSIAEKMQSRVEFLLEI